jgi:Protein of unknown function (DUF2950)
MEKKIMLQNIPGFHRESKKLLRFAPAVLVALSLGGSFAPAFAQQSGQRTFPSLQDAAHALFVAMQSQDDQSAQNVLGPAAKQVLTSGDAAEDADDRIGFVTKYQEMHRFVSEPDGTVELVVGAENWPFPIPLVNKEGSWYFDTAAGQDEIVFRRIGKNELSAIEASRELVEAQKQYFARPPAGFSKQFAQKLVSEDGRHDGLYWHRAYDEFDSPVGAPIAYADGNNAQDQSADAVPFNGYFFRILTSQGPHAPGGAKNYVVDGKMTLGFAFVAYPAEYHSSGVMTFIVNESGTVYEKDLGPDTARIAKAMSTYEPDSTWRQAE